MNYITITTPENIEIKYRLSALGSRMAAYIIDFTIISLIYTVLMIISSFIVGATLISGSYYNTTSWAIATIIISMFVLYFGYFIICEMAMNGQSIGKKALHLRVIKENGQPISIWQSIIRNLFRFFIDIFSIGIITIFFSKKCKRVGDMVASTIVIAENPKQVTRDNLTVQSLLTSTTPIMANKSYELSKEEYYLLKEYFSRIEEFSDNGKNSLDALTKYFTKRLNMVDGVITQDVLYKIMQVNNK